MNFRAPFEYFSVEPTRDRVLLEAVIVAPRSQFITVVTWRVVGS